MKNKKLIKKHVTSLEWLRKELVLMDNFIKIPIMGIKNWDDSCVVKLGNKKIVASTDGPYEKRLVMKSALIHASTDVLIKGGKPLFCLDNLIGSEKDVKEMAMSLKKQAFAMRIPILGGNTKIEKDSKPYACVTVVGELIINEPIRDSGAKKGDTLILLGKPIWGEQKERIKIAKVLFKTWFEILSSKTKINATKDVTKGGLTSTLYEISKKSKVDYKLESVPFSMTRNLDNFLISIDEENYKKIEEIAGKNKCEINVIGRVK